MTSIAESAGANGGGRARGDGRRRIVLVGAFRSVRSEGADGPFGGQGGFADTLGPAPYSLATAYLQAYAEADPEVARRWSIDRVDLAEPLGLDDDREEVAIDSAAVDRVLSLDPDAVGLSVYCWNDGALVDLAARLKTCRPGLRVVAGGRATDGDLEGLIGGASPIDAAVVGEGEIPLRDLLRRDFDPAGVPGVAAMREGRLVRGGPPVAVDDLDTIPSPFAAGLLDPPPNAMLIELGRGCRHACGYCTWNADKRLRFFGPARVEAEVRLARERGHRHATICDSAVNYDGAALGAAVEAIRRADPDREVRFTYNVRHEYLDADQLACLARLPTHTILLGVESFTEGAMRESDRAPADPGRLRATLAAVARAVRPPVASIVLGLPGDDAEGFVRTLETLLEWTEPVGRDPPAVGTVLVSLLQVYPGSKLWQRREELGLRFAPRGIPYLHESPGFPARHLAAAKAYLVRRMAEVGDRLKAAEAIVALETRGGIHPWLARDRLETLLGPWRPGESREGWTLVRIGTARDTGGAAIVRFRSDAGAEARVRLALRRGAPAGPLYTHRYDIRVEPVWNDVPAGTDRARLAAMVRAAIVRGERAEGVRARAPR